MGYAAAFLDVTARRCVVVGGGVIALKRAQALLAANAKVTIIAERLEDELADLAAQGAIAIHHTAAPEYFAGARLVYVTEPRSDLALAAIEEARAAGAELNVSDQPGKSSFITPALLTRGALQIAVSTGGASPALAKIVCEAVAELIGEEYTGLVQIMAALRPQLKLREPDLARRARLAAELIGELRSAWLAGADRQEIDRIVAQRLGAGAATAQSDAQGSPAR